MIITGKVAQVTVPKDTSGVDWNTEDGQLNSWGYGTDGYGQLYSYVEHGPLAWSNNAVVTLEVGLEPQMTAAVEFYRFHAYLATLAVVCCLVLILFGKVRKIINGQKP